jgi:hypothetical protein
VTAFFAVIATGDVDCVTVLNAVFPSIAGTSGFWIDGEI